MTEYKEYKEEFIELPMMVLRGICGFPEATLAIEVERPASIAAIRMSEQKYDSLIFFAMQMNRGQDDPAPGDVYTIGTVCRISECISFSNGRLRLIAKGLYRAERIGAVSEMPCYTVNVTPRPTTGYKYAKSMEFQAKRQLLIDNIASMRTLVHGGDTSARRLSAYTDGQEFSFNVCHMVDIPGEKKQELLEESDLKKRIDMLLDIINRQYELAVTMGEVNMKVQEHFSKQQRDAMLREEIRFLREELGESEQDDAERYRRILAECNMPEECRVKIERDVSRLENMNPMMADTQVMKNYLDTHYTSANTVIAISGHFDDSIFDLKIFIL